MATPADVVGQVFDRAAGYAASAQSGVNSFTAALNAAIYAPPTISITWSSPVAPVLPALPGVPSFPTIAFVDQSAPGTIALTPPDLVIDAFNESAPATSFPAAPTVSYGAVPAVPAAGVVLVPEAPVVVLPSVPTFLALNTPTFAGVDLRSDYLANLETIPTLDLVEPTPYYYSPGPSYASDLLANVTAKLIERIAGGSGLSPAVEQAIWGRAQSRETQIALANEAEVMRGSEALGFQLPPGVLAAQLREAQQNYYDKLSTFSRDVGIKQAEMEQENLKQTIAAGIELEGKLIDYSYKLEQLTYESAKATAENAISLYNAQVEQYKALLDAYQTYAAVYKTIIDGELAKVDVYKAEISAEQSKVDVNRALVEQYRAQIEAQMTQVKIYEAQVGGAKVLVELEQTKISAAGEQVKAYVAQVNAETAKIEAFKALVSAEATKVEVYRIKADAFASKVGAQAEAARVQVSFHEGLTRAKALEWDGYRARVDAERARMEGLAAQSRSALDGYRAAASSTEAAANMAARVFEAKISEYSSSQQVAIQTAKINGDNIMATNQARLDAAKVGAQVYAQLAGSAYSMMNANAGVSGSGSTNVSYSYSNDTTTKAPALLII